MKEPQVNSCVPFRLRLLALSILNSYAPTREQNVLAFVGCFGLSDVIN